MNNMPYQIVGVLMVIIILYLIAMLGSLVLLGLSIFLWKLLTPSLVFGALVLLLLLPAIMIWVKNNG